MKREKLFETPSSQYAPSRVLWHHKQIQEVVCKNAYAPQQVYFTRHSRRNQKMTHFLVWKCQLASCPSKKNRNCNFCYLTHRIVSGKQPDIGTAEFGQSFIRVFLPPDVYWSWLFRPTLLALVKCKSWTRDEKISCLVTSRLPCMENWNIKMMKTAQRRSEVTYLLMPFSSQVFTSASTTKCAHIFVSRDCITPFNMFKPKPRIISTISRKKPCSL